MSQSFQQYPLVILGGGYTGKRIFARAVSEGWDTRCTSRQPHVNLLDLPSRYRIHFDLNRPETWDALPSPAHVVWCFPACPVEIIRKFVERRKDTFMRTIVLGSTSAYPSEGKSITADHMPNISLSRVQGEEYLRQMVGAIILRLAGLYGPGRNVVDWIRRGKVRPTDRLVNLLHVEDAVGICLKALTEAQEGTTYLASDGIPRRWSEIFLQAALRWKIRVPPLISAPDPGKRIDNSKLRKELGYDFRFPDLYQALDELETEQPLR